MVRSPVVELNRAIAVGMAFGPAAGLELVDRLAGEPALRHLASLTSNARERSLLSERASRDGAGAATA